MPIDPRIALGYQAPQFESPLNTYAKFAQIQGMQQEQQMNALRLQAAQRETEEQNKLREFIQTMKPDEEGRLVGFGEAGRKAYESLLKGKKESREAEKNIAATEASRLKQARDLLPTVNSPEAYASWRAYTVQNLPGLANLIPQEYSPETTRNLMLEADKALEQHFVTQNLGGVSRVVAMPKYSPGTARVVEGTTAADVPVSPAVEAQKSRIARAGASNISVSTEKKFGEAFASKIADEDIRKLTVAQTAPKLAESANRIIDLAQNPNIFVGPAADIKLNIARALNVVGLNNDETIANTESLIAATGEATLNAIKDSGLGSGQGFTDKDREFLREVAGGKIGLTKETLTRLAELQHKTAIASAESWNKRVKQIPSDVLSGTGMTTEPIQVPGLKTRKQGTSSSAKPSKDMGSLSDEEILKRLNQ